MFAAHPWLHREVPAAAPSAWGGFSSPCTDLCPSAQCEPYRWVWVGFFLARSQSWNRQWCLLPVTEDTQGKCPPKKKTTKKHKQTTKNQVHLNLFELWISNVKCWVCLPLLMLVAKGINSQELVRSLPSPLLYLKGYSIKGHKNLVLAGSWTVTGMGWSSSATGLPSLFSNLKSWQIVFQWRNLLETRQLLQDQMPSGRANTWCGWAAWGIQKGICFLHWLMEWHCFFSCFCWAFLYDWQFPFLMPQAYKTTKSCLGPRIFSHILCICSFLNGKESLNISILAPPLVVEVQ